MPEEPEAVREIRELLQLAGMKVLGVIWPRPNLAEDKDEDPAIASR